MADIKLMSVLEIGGNSNGNTLGNTDESTIGHQQDIPPPITFETSDHIWTQT